MVNIVCAEGITMKPKSVYVHGDLTINDNCDSITISSYTTPKNPYEVIQSPGHDKDYILISKMGSVGWVPIEEVASELLQHPTVLSCAEKLINAKKELDMAVKLCKE